MKMQINFLENIKVSFESDSSTEITLIIDKLPTLISNISKFNDSKSVETKKDINQYTEEKTVLTTNQVSEKRFLEYCKEQDPVGDMRKIIVVSEGAKKYLGINMISIKELELLFNKANWVIPKNAVQTLRNTARRTFSWTERVTNQPGYYIVTDKGRQAILREPTY